VQSSQGERIKAVADKMEKLETSLRSMKMKQHQTHAISLHVNIKTKVRSNCQAIDTILVTRS